MAVLKANRTISDMEFYQCAMKLRKAITEWLLRDFGSRKNIYALQSTIRGIDETDKQVIDGIVAKYEVYDPRLKKLFPDWFASETRTFLLNILRELTSNIIRANSLYPKVPLELEERRKYQNRAISCCYEMLQEFAYLESLFTFDLTHIECFLNEITREIALLKGWRKSDNKTYAYIKGSN